MLKVLILNHCASNLRVDNGELEDDVLVGEGVVHGGEGIELSLGVDHVLLIQIHLQQLSSVSAVAGALAHDLGGVHNILQNALLHGGEGAGAGADSLLGSTSINILGLDSTLGHDDNVTSTMR